MDNLIFGQFIAELRKDCGMTQKDLAVKLNVTDKAVSKWETGKGFPDIKLMEPLAESLGITLIELIQCKKQQLEHMTPAEADKIVSQAMNQSQRVTTRRYLRLFRWLLIALCLMCAYMPVLSIIQYVVVWLLSRQIVHSPDIGIIGGADGPTAILTTSSHYLFEPWFLLFLRIAELVAVIACVILIIKVRKLEKELK